MGFGKIVGLGDFDITWSSAPDFTYYNYDFISPHIPTTFPIGRTVTISKDTVRGDFWDRVVTMGRIKFVLYGARGGNGGTTSYGTGGAGSSGSVASVTCLIYNAADSFTLELGGSLHHTDKGGAGGVGPTNPPTTLGKEPESPGADGIHGGGGGGCSGESRATKDYYGNVTRYIGGNGGNGGHGCSVYAKRGGTTTLNRLATAFGGGGGGGAAGFPRTSGLIDGEGGLAGKAARIVNGVVQPGAGGSRERQDDNPNGKSAVDPFVYHGHYSSSAAQPRIEVYAPQW